MYKTAPIFEVAFDLLTKPPVNRTPLFLLPDHSASDSVDGGGCTMEPQILSGLFERSGRDDESAERFARATRRCLAQVAPQCLQMILVHVFTCDIYNFSCLGSYFAGTSTGAPLSFTKNTTNFAGLDWLAFRPTT